MKPYQEIARQWRNLPAKDKTKFNNKTETVSEKKKSVAGSRSESGFSGQNLGNDSLSTSSSEAESQSGAASSETSATDSETDSDSEKLSSKESLETSCDSETENEETNCVELIDFSKVNFPI